MPTRRTWALVFFNRVLIAAIAWWTLTGGALGWDAFAVGVPVVLAAASASAVLMPRVGWSWRGAIAFAAYFVRESLLGGLDVGRRALDPRMPLDPGVVRRPLRMQSDVARVMVANTLGLVPGSLTLEVDTDELVVHALDVGRDTVASVASIQRRVGAVLRVPAPARDDSAGADADR